MTVSKPKSKSGYALPLGLVWVSLVFAGFTLLENQEFTPAPHVKAVGVFPTASSLQLDSTRPTLLLFAHPQCSCTEATFQELDRLRTSMGDHLAVTIIFPIPAHVAAGWENGELLSEAQKMTGVQIYRDTAGTETRRFGITTSGHVLLYSAAGELLFSGGITLSRGHTDGNTPGLEAITRLLHGETLARRETPVFGCTLL